MSQLETPTLKLLLIGNSSVGKSSLLLRFTDDTFLPQDEVSATIGVDFKVSMMEVDGQKYKLTIWDTAGQERFRTLTSSYYRGAQGVILGKWVLVYVEGMNREVLTCRSRVTVYDVSNRDTFDALQNWHTELKTYSSSPDVVKMIVGNKVDKESSRVVTYKEGAAMAQKLQTLFVECSAKTKVGVQEAFEELVQKIIETPSLWQKQQAPVSTIRVSSNGNEEQESSLCAC